MSESAFKLAGGPDQPVADYLAVLSCLNQYCHLVDRGGVDEIAALFAEDAALRPLYQGETPVTGRAAIRAWFQNYDDEIRAGRRHRRHKITSPFVKIDGDAAIAWCYLDSSTVIIATNRMQVSAGRYKDKLVKVEGTWLFKERVIILNHIHMIDGFGEIP
ncbi:MAG: nuclear transport factor 2 family protein [Alphaproteobacteria bacterium]|jgi:ketosteroid isomerase-like protein|nr:nuclear transport factor 2 family protein [Alphaproteobacteria bacterium]|tara:strand:- start:800 stop:1279 length:480 start_codon:yes stop_codon:yes gene_type:complete